MAIYYWNFINKVTLVKHKVSGKLRTALQDYNIAVFLPRCIEVKTRRRSVSQLWTVWRITVLSPSPLRYAFYDIWKNQLEKLNKDTEKWERAAH